MQVDAKNNHLRFNVIFKRTYDRFAFRDYRGFPIQLKAWPFVYISEQGSFREY